MSLLSPFKQHPRWGIGTFFIILVAFLLLASGSAPPINVLPGGGGVTTTGGDKNGTEGGGGTGKKFSYGSLADILARQEAVYQETIKRRTKLIGRWGGLDKVKIFPDARDSARFYTLWDFLIPSFSCPYPVDRVGTLGDGGKWVCGVDKVIAQDKCIIYSFGVNRESSFEAEILSKSSSCEFWGYDFSVHSWGPQIERNASYKERAHFHPYRFDKVDEHEANPPKWTLKGLMEENGHDFVDILKVDIERSEFDVFDGLIEQFKGKDLPFGQLQLEIHAWNINFVDFLAWWEKLENAGLRPFFTEPNLPHANWGRGPPDVSEWSFLNKNGKHALTVE